MIKLDNSNFKTEIKEGVSVVAFVSDNCGGCNLIKLPLNQLKKEYDIYTVDVINNGNIAAEYNVRSIPTILYFKDGEPLDKTIGPIPKDEIIKNIERLS